MDVCRLDGDLEEERTIQVGVARRVMERNVAVTLLQAIQRYAVRSNKVRKLDILILNHESEKDQLMVLVVDPERERLLPYRVKAIVAHMVRLVLD